MACSVDGQPATAWFEIYAASGGRVLSLLSLPKGSDLLVALQDTDNFDYGNYQAIPTPELRMEVASDPVSARRVDRVRVEVYNPACVTAQEASRLRIGMRKAEWTRTVGGRGTLVARASGVEVRDYSACYWSPIDGVSVRFVDGRVDAYAISR